MQNKYLKNVAYGFLSWLVPFVASLLFYTREGELTIDISLFKSIMIVVGSVTAAFLLISYFKGIGAGYLKEGITLGLTWLFINLLLDLVVLVSMFGMPVGDYFTQIGLRYLIIPVMTITVGVALQNKK
ncbi:hypothetical protein [Methanolobus chelungpuianus]|uniref:Uncharacterized protein n=1 Tax=Methanolobus chelungpuianus TaxID=502115 RepID=A0AAE3H9H5_9EURY|nr:hypothetical protein [Methanolobus chelungpuianus]MCQ6961633.1 hypothetical protein [Methanolobus chelungpuianus]